MTDTVKPVTAWAVVDKDGKFACDDLSRTEKSALRYAVFCDQEWPELAPHRVIQVEIKPKGEG